MNDIAFHRELAAHDARNVVLLARLAEKGVDLHAKRRIDLYFQANSESAAAQLAVAFKGGNFEAARTAGPSGASSQWSVEVGAHAAPEEVVAADYTRALIRLATDCNARYDGWGTEV